MEGDYFLNIIKKLDKRYLLVFVSGIVSGFGIHMYMLTHKLPNWDDLNNFGGVGVSSLYGRWFLDVLHPMGGTFSNPWLNGSLAIIIISLACVVMYKALGMETYTAALILPCVVMAFPSLGSTMFFMFTVDLYAVGILLSILGAYFLGEKKYGLKRIPLGFLCLMLTLGTYQSYICFSIALMLFYFIRRLTEEGDVPGALKDALMYCGVLIATILVYIPLSYAINPDMRTEGQNGIGDMSANMNPAVLLKQFFRTYKRVAEFFVFKPVSYVNSFFRLVNALVVIFLLALVLLVLVRNILPRGRMQAILYCGGWLLLPPAVAFFYVMSPEASYSSLMYYQYSLVYIFLLRMWETALPGRAPGELDSGGSELNGKDSADNAAGIGIKERLVGFVRILPPALAILAAYCCFLATVSAYFRMELAFDRVIEYYNRLYYTLENTNGYQAGDPFTFMGDYWQYKKPSPISGYSLDDEIYDDFSGMALEYGLLTSGARMQLLRLYLGVGQNYENHGDVLKAIQDSRDYSEMPVYPAPGSVRKINDVWVLKMG